MKKYILLFGTLFAFVSQNYACDGCNIYEYTSLNNRSFIGFFYRYRAFNGYAHLDNRHNFRLPTNARMGHEPEANGMYADKSPADFETYTSYELRGNFTWKEKINVQFILPYEQNVVYYERIMQFPNPETDTTLRIEGWGDLMLAADYIFMKSNGKWKHIFRPGFAVRLPTGQYQQTGSDGTLHDPVVQPGTGAWGWVFRANYLASYRNTGFLCAVNYQLSGNGQHGYDFANSFNASADVFQQFFMGNIAIVPRLGAYMERASYDHYQNQVQQLTGGTSWFANFALDFNLEKWTVQLAFQQPVAESLHGNQLGNAGRLNIGLVKGF